MSGFHASLTRAGKTVCRAECACPDVAGHPDALLLGQGFGGGADAESDQQDSSGSLDAAERSLNLDPTGHGAEYEPRQVSHSAMATRVR
jgi:hypothetical protein